MQKRLNSIANALELCLFFALSHWYGVGLSIHVCFVVHGPQTIEFQSDYVNVYIYFPLQHLAALNTVQE